MTDFKPMLAETVEDLSRLQFPLFASPKLDGIRCVVRGGLAWSRSLKPIPNAYVRACIEQARSLDGCDGELMLPDHTAPFAEVTSAIMSEDGQPEFVYRVFDWTLSPGLGYAQRLSRLQAVHYPEDFASMVEQVECGDLSDLLLLHEAHMREGYEGTMVRAPDSPYKFGRSTLREGFLLKIKPFADEEAIIIGFVEEQQNTNAATRDEVGKLKRSSAQAGKVGKDTLGALECRFADNTKFECGTGLTRELRAKIWAQKDYYLGKLIKVKHLPPPGGRKPGTKPRHPVFLGFRED